MLNIFVSRKFSLLSLLLVVLPYTIGTGNYIVIFVIGSVLPYTIGTGNYIVEFYVISVECGGICKLNKLGFILSVDVRL